MSLRVAIICDQCTSGYAVLEDADSQEWFSSIGWSFNMTDPITHERRDYCIPCTNQRHHEAGRPKPLVYKDSRPWVSVPWVCMDHAGNCKYFRSWVEAMGTALYLSVLENR